MYPYIRAAYVMLKARSLPPMAPYDTHVSHHRAWPWDTDMFGELNNGRILTLFELGRWQAAVRAGLFRTENACRYSRSTGCKREFSAMVSGSSTSTKPCGRETPA